MATETRQCQNCKQDFRIEPDDLSFYEKIKVPPPTFCPECRMRRRMAIRNERSLYHNVCALCGTKMLAMYPAESPFVVYCLDCWWSDKWDPLDYGTSYNPDVSFWGQFERVFRTTPRAALYQTLVEDSKYSNYAINLKGCYLVFGGHHYENCAYSEQSGFLKDCFDVAFSRNCEYCYESVDLTNCSRVCFSGYSEDCTDSRFLYNCRNVDSCVGCVNLRNQSHCIFNVKYSKDEYLSRLAGLKLETSDGLTEMAKKMEQFSGRFPRKFAVIRNCVNVTGDNIFNSKNCRYAFNFYKDIENCNYSFFMPDNTKDSYDCDHTGLNTELMYEVMSASYASRAYFSNRVVGDHDIWYSDDCHDSHDLFGCVGLRKKEYCILNKQYTKEEYGKLLPQLVENLTKYPFSGAGGRTYAYGEFFPPELSPFAYNETVAQEYFPLTEKRAREFGYAWHPPTTSEYAIDLAPRDLPQTIAEVDDSVLTKVIGCAHGGNCSHRCSAAFKIIQDELSFYRRLHLPLPRLCPSCRHYERSKLRNPIRLWHRACQCSGAASENGVYRNTGAHQHGAARCPNEFETSYAPDRPEIVYCEQCYNAEVV